ncbi:MAG: flagellar motor switch protein FliM [Pirellulaceae bacterium]|nr:flagellar motor switch protein FliM [Pirellulaceae bacterium]
MSDDTLGNQELEELLRSLDAGDGASAAASTAQRPAAPPADDEAISAMIKPTAPRQRVVAYDFKRPERVGKEQMRAMQSLHEGFARSFGASLSALLRTIAEAKLISVDQLTYSEFVYSLEIPTCFNLLRPTPLEGNWILDISPSILYPIIDRMLGGSSSADSALKRPLSEIELRLTQRVTQAFLRDLASAWENAVDLNIELERVESNPQLVQIVPPNEVVILVSLELLLGKSRGTVNLCIPFNTIERIGNKLTSNSWKGYASSRSNQNTAAQIEALIDHSEIEVVVEVVNTDIRAVDLLNLQVGDIITTDKDCRSPLEVTVAGVGKFHARAGAFKGRKAVEILATIPQPAPVASPVAEAPAAS